MERTRQRQGKQLQFAFPITLYSILSRLGDLEKSKVEITTKIREIEILIDRLRDTVKSPDIYKHGDDMVYFGRLILSIFKLNTNKNYE